MNTVLLQLYLISQQIIRKSTMEYTNVPDGGSLITNNIVMMNEYLCKRTHAMLQQFGLKKNIVA